MRRRDLLKGTTAIALQSVLASSFTARAVAASSPIRRLRPSDPEWPSEARWKALSRDVGDRLIKVQSPLSICRDSPRGTPCLDIFKELKNPYYIGDEAGLTQTCGWLDAWTAEPSAYAVAARKTEDVVAAVNFARDNNLRLVVKGGDHSYLGTSNAPDSLLIWTHAMNDITLHDAFVPQGCAGRQAPQPAVTVGAGAIWMHAYNEVTTKGGRYVQGGGCATVGVAGLVTRRRIRQLFKELRHLSREPAGGRDCCGGGSRADCQLLDESRPCSGCSRAGVEAVSVSSRA
jgi:FAD binding domain